MSRRLARKLTLILTMVSIIAVGCGTAASEETIATSVALTVQAQNSQVAVPSSTPLPTQTPLALPTIFTPTLIVKPTFPTLSSGEASCARASLAGETIPDGTIMTPGQQFTKIWHITNTSTCTWNTNYKIVFWDGDQMGGGYVYNFPQQALPGDTVDVPLVLTAPTAEGTYQSFWKIQTPGGASFGVGYDEPFWAEIIVSTDTNYDYGITDVTYQIVRDPEFGCPANVWYYFSAVITVNGPLTVIYNFSKSDGTSENKKTLKFTEAGSKSTVTWSWSLHLGSATNERWIKLFTVAPNEQEFEPAFFHYTCGQQ